MESVEARYAYKKVQFDYRDMSEKVYETTWKPTLSLSLDWLQSLTQFFINVSCHMLTYS